MLPTIADGCGPGVDNWFHQLGPGTSAIPEDPTPREVSRTYPTLSVCLREAFHCLALKRDGTLWSWGCNSTGQSGQNAVAGPDRPPGAVTGLDHVSDFSGGYLHSLTIGHRPR